VASLVCPPQTVYDSDQRRNCIAYQDIARYEPPKNSISSGDFVLDPQIEAFITQSLQPNSYIRSRLYHHESMTIILHIGSNRYCRRISRAHKSNHVYFIVDLKTMSIQQRCTDPECADFRSNAIPIPVEISSRLLDVMDLQSFDVDDLFTLDIDSATKNS
jgi:hypothetical protein